MNAAFSYDGDGKRVKSTINGRTTYFIGAHYEVTGSEITKYYGVYGANGATGMQRIATLAPHCVWCSAGVRTYSFPQNSTVNYLISDHLGSTSLTTSAKVRQLVGDL